MKWIIAFILVLSGTHLFAQYTIFGRVHDEAGNGLKEVVIFNEYNNSTTTHSNGAFELKVATSGDYKLIFFAYGYELHELSINTPNHTIIDVTLKKLSKHLSEVVIREQREKIFNLKRLKHVEGTAIYAGKKSEVVLLDQMVGNKASNNARQVYAQVVGLNIYESSDAGLQLNIGGRGLDPNRTSNFNTRQNGYDISADVLGYPESYYTPPPEALAQIQIVRGAASLQYGTQFGGLINFKLKKPLKDKKVGIVSRQSIGSNRLFTTFNSVSGTMNKLSYYTYFHHKQGDGARANSKFLSNNIYTHIAYQWHDKTCLSFEYTYLTYLAKQPGGLTDTQFDANPIFSNRTRNWFEVNWQLTNLKMEHKFSSNAKVSLSLFMLHAERNAIGYRGSPSNLNSNPVSEEDHQDETGNFLFSRNLILGKFKNYGAEARFLARYSIKGKDMVVLVGTKLYKSNNTTKQGEGNKEEDINFNFQHQPQSSFKFPNSNIALFGENIFYLSNNISLTPGFRIEYIHTQAQGFYQKIVYDNANNPLSSTSINENKSLVRSFVLFGIGVSYTTAQYAEYYANLSQNYRSITYNDIRVVSPSFIIDPNIADEHGFTADIGMKGYWKNKINYDIGTFALMYNDRIGIVLDDRANRVRKNIGKAFIYGFELFVDFNVIKLFKLPWQSTKFNWFINTAFTHSNYLESENNNVKGRQVEFIPFVNLKTGVNLGYRNLMSSIQWLYLSSQYTDAENSHIPSTNDSRLGMIGAIPPYHVMDISFAYTWKKWKLETGINNVLNNRYFTRRATGYPGPGIIPANPKTVYLTVELKI